MTDSPFISGLCIEMVKIATSEEFLVKLVAPHLFDVSPQREPVSKFVLLCCCSSFRVLIRLTTDN